MYKYNILYKYETAVRGKRYLHGKRNIIPVVTDIRDVVYVKHDIIIRAEGSLSSLYAYSEYNTQYIIIT